MIDVIRLQRIVGRRRAQSLFAGSCLLAATLALTGGAGKSVLIGPRSGPAKATVVRYQASEGAPTTRAKGTASKGGSLHVLEGPGNTWPTLDPPLITAPNNSYYQAIYGELFEQGPRGQIIPDLATGYKLANGARTFVIYLRHGVTFSDGAPFNAKAVAFNITRDLEPKYACPCALNFPVASVTEPDSYTVVLHLKKPAPSIKYAFFDAIPNYTVSPTALKSMGEHAYGLHPVGAGPFEVATNSLGNKLVLKRNPHYWEKGHPYLDSLTFSIAGTPQVAEEALEAGDAGAYQGLSQVSLIEKLPSGLRATPMPSSVGALVVGLNTRIPPFNNIKAREAIYYATDPEAINRHLFDGRATVLESPTVPSGLFFEQRVPGYRHYDLSKAKSLVKQLGGLSFTLIQAIGGTPLNLDVALQSEWAEAGIHASVSEQQLPAVVQDMHAGKWQANLGDAGGFDPDLGDGLLFTYESHALFSGISDPTLDKLIAEGETAQGHSQQSALYRKIFHYISVHAYTPFITTTPSWAMTRPSVSGPGLTSTGWQVFWEDVRVK